MAKQRLPINWEYTQVLPVQFSHGGVDEWPSKCPMKNRRSRRSMSTLSPSLAKAIIVVLDDSIWFDSIWFDLTWFDSFGFYHGNVFPLGTRIKEWRIHVLRALHIERARRQSEKRIRVVILRSSLNFPVLRARPSDPCRAALRQTILLPTKVALHCIELISWFIEQLRRVNQGLVGSFAFIVLVQYVGKHDYDSVLCWVE